MFSDAFSKGASVPLCSPRFAFAATLNVSRPEDPFIHLIANSIFWSKNTIISDENCGLDSVFERANIITPFQFSL